MKKILFIVLALILSLAVVAIYPAIDTTAAKPGNNESTVNVTVNTSNIVKDSFTGMGIEWDPHAEYPTSSADWTTLVSRVNYLKPGIIRCMVLTRWYLTGFDASGDPAFNFTSAEMQRAYMVLDYCQANGVDVIWGDWGPPGEYNLTFTDVKWARAAAGCVDYLINTRGYTCIKNYNYGNEPDGSWSGCGSFTAYKTAVKTLKAEFDARSLSSKVKISGPDTFDNLSWLDTALRNQTLTNELTAYDVHRYKYNSDVKNHKIEDIKSYRSAINSKDPAGTSKEFYVNECGLLDGKTDGDTQPNVRNFWYGVSMADVGAQVMRAGLSGAIAWDLDDAMHPNDGVSPFKTWGFWNSQGAEMGNAADENLRPWFNTWSLMSRLFPKGSTIVDSGANSTPGVTAAAMKKANGSSYDMSFMVVNNSGTAQTVILNVPNAADTPTLKQYNYFDTDRPTDANGFPVVKQTLTGVDLVKGITVSLPSDGVIFLTTMDGGTAVSLN